MFFSTRQLPVLVSAYQNLDRDSAGVECTVILVTKLLVLGYRPLLSIKSFRRCPKTLQAAKIG